MRVETPDFIVYGETGERRVHEVAEEFERFRDALARVIRRGRARRRADGRRRVRVGAILRTLHPPLQRQADQAQWLLLRERRHESSPSPTETATLAAHDFSQVRPRGDRQPSRAMPLWLNEGLAEYYR